MHTRYLGPIIKQYAWTEEWSTSTCYYTCKEDSRCKYWTYMWKEGCKLLSEFTGQKSEDTMISGRRCSGAEERDYGTWK